MLKSNESFANENINKVLCHINQMNAKPQNEDEKRSETKMEHQDIKSGKQSAI